jgi:hypothetical protein
LRKTKSRPLRKIFICRTEMLPFESCASWKNFQTAWAAWDLTFPPDNVAGCPTIFKGTTENFYLIRELLLKA